MDYMLLLNFLALFSMIAAAYVLIIGNSASALHILFSGVRLFRGHPSRFSWLLAGRSMIWLAAVIWNVLFLLIRSSEAGAEAKSYNDILIGTGVLILVVALAFQVLLPIIEILRNRRTSSYLLTICCFLSYPLLYSFVLYISAELAFASGLITETQPAPQVEEMDPGTRDIYKILDKDSDAREVYSLPKLKYNSNGDVKYSSDNSKNEDTFISHAIGLWLETSWNKIIFDQPSLSINLTAIDFNRKNIVVGHLIWAYELTINFFFWAIVFVLARALARRIVTLSE